MKIETSAGGIVYRKTEDKTEFLVVQHSGHHRWVLPKGWIDFGETKEQAATREVKEESGVEAEIGEYLGEFTIFYTNPQKEKVRKTSHFFLMKYKSGTPEKDHGWEIENTAWLSSEGALEKLDYPGEKKMVEKAAKQLGKYPEKK
ncbi:NUDIX domain-containing protein [Patescibacteria group bacterium]|nr:NUDIX domain-containing protein [Patescibacteria group bacterium]